MTPHQNTCRQSIPHTPCPVNGCLKDNHAGHSGFSTSVYRKPINLYKCCKRRVVPGSWTPEPRLQRLCGTQVKQFFGSEQWNPSLHMQMLRFLGSCSGVSKLLSERRSDTSCVKHTSISTGMFWLNVSQSLTFVAVRLTFTLGFLRVSILIFILIACLALRLLTSAKGRHAGP